jgi:molecular chaperone DnaK
VVQLDLTLDGVLKVNAREKATGLQKHITIENALARFEREEREAASARLEEMWQQSFDEPDFDDEDDSELAESGYVESMEDASAAAIPIPDAGPREGQREAVQARALLEKSERLRDNASAEDQKELDRLNQNLRVALQDRNWNELETASAALADVLFYLEDA